MESLNRFDTVKEEEPTKEEINQAPKESVDSIQNETQKTLNMKGAEDIETET